ncbi:hypothetical protein EUX98_g5507 [Antrodiella citrinella]|uniref:Uncharacterized protein n=1 Tax=Antrodiella citrinella TaxID=2447956 RepID=A0A4S4MTL6_9APHY|nr:hypothetical protein EUX98_g5507 [Antrodiella citrinella]
MASLGPGSGSGISLPGMLDMMHDINDKLSETKGAIGLIEKTLGKLGYNVGEGSGRVSCNQETCISALQVEKLKQMVAEKEKVLLEKDQEIIGLRRQVLGLQARPTLTQSEADDVEMQPTVERPATPEASSSHHVHRPLSPVDSVTIGEDDDGTQTLDLPKPSLVTTDLRTLNRPTVLPEWSSLEPCFMTTKKTFALDIPTGIVSQSEPMYCYQGLLWHTAETRDHAYLIRPQSLFNPLQLDRDLQWTANTELDGIVGHVREVFYPEDGSGCDVRYAGTYRFLETVELLPSDHDMIPEKLLGKIRSSGLAVDGSALSTKLRSKAFKNIHTQYQAGNKMLVCLVMQCIGFNKRLYEDLMLLQGPKRGKRMAKAASKELSKKRKLVEDDEARSRKRMTKVSTFL